MSTGRRRRRSGGQQAVRPDYSLVGRGAGRRADDADAADEDGEEDGQEDEAVDGAQEDDQEDGLEEGDDHVRVNVGQHADADDSRQGALCDGPAQSAQGHPHTVGRPLLVTDHVAVSDVLETHKKTLHN